LHSVLYFLVSKVYQNIFSYYFWWRNKSCECERIYL